MNGNAENRNNSGQRRATKSEINFAGKIKCTRGTEEERKTTESVYKIDGELNTR